MMQRSDLLLIALAVFGIPLAYLAFDVVGAVLMLLAIVTGAVVGALAAPRPRRAEGAEAGPRPKRLRGRAAAARVHPPLATSGAVVLEPPARARARTTFVPAMEPASAELAFPREAPRGAPRDPHGASLRLTGDILRGMQVGKTQRGICSRCSATIWLSAQRPVRARCPVCGYSRILS